MVLVLPCDVVLTFSIEQSLTSQATFSIIGHNVKMDLKRSLPSICIRGNTKGNGLNQTEKLNSKTS